MFIKSSFVALVAAVSVYGRFALPGRLGSACAGNICGVLGGKTISTLLAASPECAQQDLADEIIDASKDQDAATAANMVALAIEFRQCEKNTPPDFTANPPALRNSVFCQKAPANQELVGLVQAQDPANDPTLFFDPATKSTVLAGSQANTVPFGGAAAVNNVINVVDANVEDANVENIVDVNAGCPAPAVVTVTIAANSAANTEAAANIEIIDESQNNVAQNVVAVNDASGALDFGDCTNPAVEFGGAFGGRKLAELSFQPQNPDEFAQGSALNKDIVFKAICNILADRCNAPEATNAACQAAISAADALQGGASADAFNAGLGIQSNFAEVLAAPGGGPGIASAQGQPNFNKCDAPQVAFGIFDGRKENSFAPAGDDFVHGSALNPNIILDFLCDQLVNQCDADQVAQDNCRAAQDAAQGLEGQDLVDAFNARVVQAV
jgi:hypothetical protein